MKKTAISLILALALVFCLGLTAVPQAMAAENDGSHTDHCVCGGLYAGQTSTVHTCSTVTGWTELTLAVLNDTTTYCSGSAYNLKSGNYYLGSDLTLAKRIFPAEGSTVTICLNGYELKSTSSTSTDGRVLNANRANTVLNVCDCKGTGKMTSTATSCHGGLIQIAATVTTAEVNLYGGTLIGNTLASGKYGGAVYQPAGTFNMHGGIIQDGNANGGGGNIYSSGTFNMYGGTIQNGNAAGRGGNVSVSGTMNMYGGLITGGKSSVAGGNIGQASSSAALNIAGGTVTGGKSTASHGGNIAVYGSLAVTGGTVSDGTALVKGGNIFINGSSAAINGGTISGGTDSMGAGIWINGSKTLTVGENASIQCSVFDSKNRTLTLNDDLNATLDPGTAVHAAASSDKVSQYKANARIVINLNGFNLSGKIKNTVDKDTTHTYAVYIKDSATADFDVSDNMYGIFSATLENVALANYGVGVGGETNFNTDSNDVYVAISEGSGSWSFHAVCLGICDMDVEMDADGNVDISYATSIKTNAKVKALMSGDNAYGLKIYLLESNAQTAGMAASGFVVGSTGNTVTVRLTDIMTVNGQNNAAKALALIKAKPYIVIAGNRVEGVEYSNLLQNIVEAMDQEYAVLSIAQQQLLVDMYEAYTMDMINWNIPNIKEAANITLPTVSAEEEETLRQKVLDYMYDLCTITWTPTETVTLNCSCGASRHTRTFTAGVTYTGMPYSHSSTSYEKFMSHVDGTTLELGEVDINDIGNDCADSIYWAWSQISAGITFTQTNNAMCYNGTLPVGSYAVNGQVTTSTYDTAAVCTANGAQTMYLAYAQIKKGDAILYATPGGHMRMAYQNAEVVYVDGQIDPASSYIYTYEQGGWTGNGIGCVITKYSFADLFEDNYIPLTMAAFTQGADAEQVFVCNAADATLSQMAATGYVTSNYRINSMTLEVKDASDNTVAQSIVYPFFGSTSNGNIVELSVFQEFVDGLSLTSGAQYTYEIIVHVGDADVVAQSVGFTA